MNLFKRLTNAKQAEKPATADRIEPRHLTGDEFDTIVLKSELPAVVDFWAEWCNPCHAIAPAVTHLATEFDGRALVAKLNADEFPEIIERYGIRGIPTLLYFKAGKERDRVVGMTGYGTLKGKLEQLLSGA